MKLRNLLIAAAGVATFVGAANSALAATWQQNHPARVEVNTRRGNLNSEISSARTDHNLTRLQAMRLHDQANQVRYQERVFARHNGGHLTIAEQTRLNQAENRIQTETAEGRVGHP